MKVLQKALETLTDLSSVLADVWQTMHMEHFHKLGAFMPRPIAVVIKAKGGAML